MVLTKYKTGNHVPVHFGLYQKQGSIFVTCRFVHLVFIKHKKVAYGTNLELQANTE